MEPMDYVFHNHPRPSAAQYDPVHAATASSGWGPQSNPPPPRAPTFSWQNPPRASPSLHRISSLMTGPDHYQIPPGGGLPPPYAGFYGGPMPNEIPGSVAPQHFHSPPYGRLPTARHSGESPGVGSDDAFINQLPAPGRPETFLSPAGMGMYSAGSNPEPNSLPRPPLPPSGHSANSFAQQHHPPPFALPPPGPTPPRRNHYPSSSLSARPPRDVQPPNRTTQSTPSRRPHPRARRSVSRYTPTEMEEDDEESVTRQIMEHLRANGFNGSADSAVLEDQFLRHIQLFRGSGTVQQVASRKTIQSLQSVKIEDLDESDRVCIICYNEFGTETPEGINEAPLRLPKCKHVFGDHCIKKWFENSDNCPYCRDKVHSEPKHHISSSRAFLAMMRMRSQHSQRGTENEHPVQETRRTASVEGERGHRQSQTGERRSPPEDDGEQRRRTRPRRANSIIPSTPSVPAAPTPPSTSSTPAAQAAPAAPPIPSGPPASYTSLPLPLPYPPSTGTTHMSPPRMGQTPYSSGPTAQHTWSRPPMSWEMAGPAGGRASSSSTSMSAAAPSFYPQGPNEDNSPVSGDGQSSDNTIPPPHMMGTILPNPLHSTRDFTQERQRQPRHLSAYRSSWMNMSTSSDQSDPMLPDQINNNRAW